MLILGGCSSSVAWTDNELNMVAEYIAGTMLKYDKNYEEALVNIEEYEEELQVAMGNQPTTSPSSTPTPTPTPNDVEEKPSSENSTIHEVIGGGKVNVEYKSYKTFTSYPKNSKYFSVDAAEGNELIVVFFELTNQSSKENSIDLISKNVKYQLNINTETYYQPLLTLLSNDVQFLNMELEPNKTVEAVLVYEVPQELNKKEIKLIISDKNKTASVTIK